MKTIKIQTSNHQVSIYDYHMLSLEDRIGRVMLTVVSKHGMVYTAYVTTHIVTDLKITFDATNLEYHSLENWIKNKQLASN